MEMKLAVEEIMKAKVKGWKVALDRQAIPFFSSSMKGLNTKQTTTLYIHLSLSNLSPTNSKILSFATQHNQKPFFSIVSFSCTKERERDQMLLKQPNKSSFRESLKALEADIQHANNLAAAVPRDYGGEYVQMRLGYSPFAPFVLFLIEWMDYSCTDTLPSYLGLLHIIVYKVYVDGMPTLSSKERKATLREFYAVIYPSLRQLEGEFIELEDNNKRNQCSQVSSRKRVEDRRKLSDKDLERDNECGICMENCGKMVLPNCGHSMCISCFHDWNMRSQSCPFCRGSLKRVSSKDLWVLICNSDINDTVTIAKENLMCFYLYIENLPLVTPESHPYVQDYMI